MDVFTQEPADWMSRPFNTIQLYLSMDAGEAGGLLHRWYRQGWEALGYELREWFTSEAERSRLRQTMPVGAVLELYRHDGASSDGSTQATDDDAEVTITLTASDLDEDQWARFLTRIEVATSATVDAGQLVASEFTAPYRGNADEVLRGITLEHDRYGNHVILRASARWEHLLTVERQNATVEFLYGIANACDASYGEVAHSATGLGYTAYEYALGLLGSQRLEVTLDTARASLRGYGWITVVPRQLAERLGTLQDLSAMQVFSDIRTLNRGGLWLQATRLFIDYDEEAARRVGHALTGILRPGTPIPSLAKQSKVVSVR